MSACVSSLVPAVVVERGSAHPPVSGGVPADLLDVLVDDRDGVVLGQVVADGKTNESAFAPLLDRIEISARLVTADPLHTQVAHARYLHGRGGHYLFTVKGDQPTLRRILKGLPWKDIPTLDVTCDKGHGRLETRSVKSLR